MSFKKILLCLLTVCFLGIASPSFAGVVSKGIKGVVAAKVIQKAAPTIAKKIVEKKAKKVVQNGVKDSTKTLMKKELKVGEYGKLKQSPEKGVDYHHMPSSKQMEKYGVKKDDGIAMGVEKNRHSLTRTYKGRNREHLNGNEAPREALARDIKDARQIYQDNGHYNKNVRESLQEVVKQNKEKFPDLYKKQ